MLNIYKSKKWLLRNALTIVGHYDDARISQKITAFLSVCHSVACATIKARTNSRFFCSFKDFKTIYKNTKIKTFLKFKKR